MTRPRIPPPLRRRSATRSPKIKLYIICEGKNTEPNYLEQFAEHFGNGLVRLRVVGAGGVPMTLAKAAVAELKSQKNVDRFDRADQFWVVFDKDTHPNIPQAMTLAKSNGVKVAYSNPCFELWAILHYRDFDAPLGHKQVQSLYKSCDTKYDPNSTKQVDFPVAIRGYREALKRASQMRDRRISEGTPLGAPYTDFDALALLIEKNGKG